MQRIGTQNGLFAAGNPTQGIRGTTVTADWLNAMQEEVVNVVEGAGLTPSGADLTQLLQAIQIMLNSHYIPGGHAMLWMKPIAEIPAGWALCDGGTHNGIVVPNMTDCYIMHADADSGGTHNVGSSINGNGGTAGHALTIAEMPPHDHPYINETGNSGPGSAGPGIAMTPTQTVTGEVGSGDAHAHGITDYKPKSKCYPWIIWVGLPVA